MSFEKLLLLLVIGGILLMPVFWTVGWLARWGIETIDDDVQETETTPAPVSTTTPMPSPTSTRSTLPTPTSQHNWGIIPTSTPMSSQ